MSHLFLQNELEGWGISDTELADAVLIAAATELLALLGRDKATKAVQKLPVAIDEIASKREHIMDTA
jgi:hypothetical protein